MDTPEKKAEEQTPATPKQDVKKVAAKRPPVDATKRTRILMMVAVGAVVLAVGFSIGWLSRHHGDDRAVFNGAGIHRAEGFGPGHAVMKERLIDNETNATDGTTISRLNGVVTQVGADSFTIAGNGTTKTIKTDANTNYSVSSNKVSVNDSVSVRGTQSGDTFTADTVNVLNR